MFGLKRETDYAVQFLQYLASKEKKIVSIKEFSKKSGISFWFLQKIARRLNLAGIIEAKQGIKGGYILNADAKNLNLYKIFKIMEGEPLAAPCLGRNDYACNNFNKKCAVKKIIAGLNCKIIKELRQIKI